MLPDLAPHRADFKNETHKSPIRKMDYNRPWQAYSAQLWLLLTSLHGTASAFMRIERF